MLTIQKEKLKHEMLKSKIK